MVESDYEIEIIAIDAVIDIKNMNLSVQEFFLLSVEDKAAIWDVTKYDPLDAFEAYRKVADSAQVSKSVSDLYDVADSMDFTELCKSMHLISDLPEFIKPRNVALMFFNSEPHEFFPCAQIDVIQFPEGEGGDKIIEQVFKGPLHEQLRAALRYIQNSIITEKVIKYPDRAESDRFFNYPYAAIEEALANAVYHKAYDEREPIEVRVTHDMIEIISHPGPDRSVTLQGLKEYKVYSRRYRNRRIGEFLKDLHLTEGRNTGFRKIINSLQANGSPLPEFETDEAHDYFVTRLFIREGFYDEGENGGSTTLKLPPNDMQEMIIELMKINPNITRKEIADTIGLTVDGARYHIKKLTDKGKIKYVGTSRNGHWEVKNEE